MKLDSKLLCCLFLFGTISATVPSMGDDYRASAGLQVLYDFSESDGNVIRDQSDHEPSIDLQIENLEHVRRGDGTLQVVRPTMIRTAAAPTRLLDAVRSSGEITVEAWVQPDNTKQDGPARVVTISRDSSSRNFTLGQEGNFWQVRLRTTRTSTNGMPALASRGKTVKTELMHVVYTHAKGGLTRIYIAGRQVAENRTDGNTSNWDRNYRLALANELSSDRPWLGTFHMVAIYSRALTAEEVSTNFSAGPQGKPSPEQIAERKRMEAARHFETTVAPLLARHCVECHDSATHENGLDLSKKLAALRGSENGQVIVPGKSAESPIWAAVKSDSMPLDRPPLTAAEKQALKKWIDDGAVWSLAEIDPAIYAHGGASQSFVRRLTISEYIETVRAATGVDIAEDAREILPADLRADGFSNTAYNLTVDLKHVDAYSRLAEIIVSRLNVPEFVSRFSNRRRFTDKDMGEVIAKVGRWLLRGPVEEREIIAYRGITTTVASAGGSFDEAVSLVVEAMLQSPRFIYRVEKQPAAGEVRNVDDYELASRLSYMIWGGPPDEELLDAAETQSLGSVDLEQHVDRMLNDPRAVAQSLRFVKDWLNLNRLQNLKPDSDRFPNWNAGLADDMQRETVQFFEDVVWTQKKPLSALLNAQVTFATPRLAAFYGLDENHRDGADGRYDLSEISSRGGLLTQGSVLTIGGDNASMVTRGLLVMHEFLRGVVKDPPPCVDTTPVPTKPGLTQRAIALQRISNANCGGCHSRFEPLAFGLEKFDGIGAHHEQDEHGNRLRDDGEILVPGAAAPVKYNSSTELMNILADSERVRQSLTWKVTQFAMGRPLGAADASVVADIHRESQKNGGTWTALIKAIAISDLVRLSWAHAATPH